MLVLLVLILSCICFDIGLSDCLPTIPLVLHDIHDGDEKLINSVTWDTFTIKSYPNTTQWEISGKWDINCAAMIDFNVPGKEDYPPVPLKMKMWIMQSDAVPSAVKLAFEFTDPSETLAPRTQPLNIWLSEALSVSDSEKLPIDVKKKKEKVGGSTCIYTPHNQPKVFNDIFESNMKSILVDSDDMTIKPYDNNQDWTIQSTFQSGCISLVNFNVPGYPNPPTTPLTAQVWGMAAISGETKDSIVYFKPTEYTLPMNVYLPGNDETSQ